MTAPEPTPEGFLVPPAWWNERLRNAEGNARLASALIPDTRPPRKPLPWRWRARRRLRARREQAARVAYRIIAGYWPANGEDDW